MPTTEHQKNYRFDLHFHLLFKKFVTQWENHYPSRRGVDQLLGIVEIRHALWNKIDEWFLHFLESQSCYQQVVAGGMRMGVAAIAPVERMFSSEEGLGKLLNDQIVTAPLDQTYLDKIRQGDISYYHLFLKELELYKLLAQKGKIQIMSRAGEMETEPAEKSAPIIALGLEGGHSLCRTRIGKPGQRDQPHPQEVLGDKLYQDFMDHPILPPHKSLQHLQQALWDEKMDLFYLCITHLSHIPEQHLATHAYGMKFLKDAAKYPRGNGISRLGEQVVETAYNLKVIVSEKEEGQEMPKYVDAPVLLDLKHMSLKSRLDLYKIRKERGIDKPLLATHMGVTGYSIEEWKEALQKAEKGKTPVPVVKLFSRRQMAGKWGKINNKFTYNAWTINLMDEDIIEILNSRGLIGISLDVRILGWQSLIKKREAEFMSPEEFHYFFPHISIQDLRLENPDEDEEEEKELMVAESYLLPEKEERHPLAFCFNLLHVISVGKLYAQIEDPWKHVCLGSDYDGMIDPLKNCRNAGSLQHLRGLLLKWLPIAEASYRKQHGGPELLPKKLNTPDMAALEEKISGFLFENGRRFLENWSNQRRAKVAPQPAGTVEGLNAPRNRT